MSKLEKAVTQLSWSLSAADVSTECGLERSCKETEPQTLRDPELEAKAY